MKRLINVKWAGNLLLIAFGLLAILHILILLNIVPSELVWGGQINDSATKLILELIALLATFLFAVIVAAKLDYIKAGKFRIVVNIGVWVIFAYLILNTLGNLASGVSLEKLIFTPLTVVLALCALRLAIEK